MLDLRVYRTAFLPALIAVFVVAFSLQSRPSPVRTRAVADAFDAMTTTRAYRPPKTPTEAFEELRQCAGTHFDPEVVDAFTTAFRDVTALPIGR